MQKDIKKQETHEYGMADIKTELENCQDIKKVIRRFKE
jgi:hypothetical protein